MATATMGLRRRTQIGNSTSATSSTSSGAGSKRTRSENNNSPSQGNLNSPEPAPKKTRSGAACNTRSSTKAKEQEQVKKAPPPWSDRSLASIAGLTLGGQGANLQLPESVAALSSPLAFMSSSMATFVGNAAASLGKGTSGVSYLDISNMTARPPGWPTDPTDAAKGPLGLPFPPVSTVSTPPFQSNSNSKKNSNEQEQQQQQQINNGSNKSASSPTPAVTLPQTDVLPKNFPNDSMFTTYQPWVIRTYGDLAKTKTITIKKYARILRTLRGEEVNSAENSKFRFWVKSKGFHIGQPEGYEAKPADGIIGRHAVTSPGLDPPLYVPTPPPHNKNLNGVDGNVSSGRVYKKVAIVENFFDIIHAVHVDLEGRPGKHAGQKRTYRTITETYAFLPREAVTRFLLGCTECQRRPRTPSPTSLTIGSTGSKPNTPTPTSTPPLVPSSTPPLQQTQEKQPPSPKPATAMTSATVTSMEVEGSKVDERPKEASHAPEPKNLPSNDGQELEPKVATSSESAVATTKPISSSCNNVVTATSLITSTTNTVCDPKIKDTNNRQFRDDKYNPLSITNLLRKDPITRRPPITISMPQIPDHHTTTTTATTTSCSPTTQSTTIPRWGELKGSPLDYTAAFLNPLVSLVKKEFKVEASIGENASEAEDENFSQAAGLIDTNLNLLATIQHLHCQVMLALTERLRPPVASSPSATASLTPNQNNS